MPYSNPSRVMLAPFSDRTASYERRHAHRRAAAIRSFRASPARQRSELFHQLIELTAVLLVVDGAVVTKLLEAFELAAEGVVFLGCRRGRRVRDGAGKIQFAHTLNNTVIASPRILIPLLELNQNADGSVTIPAVLRGYMGGMERIEPPA